MTKPIFTLLSVSVLALTACSDKGSDQVEGSDAATAASADADAGEAAAAKTACTQENMMEKATEVSNKMQALASDPAKMQDLSAKMMEIQKKVQDSSADGSYSLQDACDAYDELLAL